MAALYTKNVHSEDGGRELMSFTGIVIVVTIILITFFIPKEGIGSMRHYEVAGLLWTSC